MTIGRSTLLFCNASALVTASASSRGGAARLRLLCRRGMVRGAVSQPVLMEAERNVRENLPALGLQRLFHLLSRTPLEPIGLPRGWRRAAYRDAVGEKDEHVLAAALAARADYLITLDRGLRVGVNAAGLPIEAQTPGGFIEDVLPRHSDCQRPGLYR